MTTENKNQLALFNFGGQLQGTLTSFTTVKERKTSDGTEVNGLSLGLMKKKDIAELLDLKGKDNAPALERKMIELTDELKGQMAREIVGIAQSDVFTGGTVRVTKNKQGMRTVNFSFKEVAKGKRGPSDAEIARAWGCSEEQVRVMRERQTQAMLDARNNTINVPAVDNQPAANPEN